ncbi:MAG: C25 family cysteine peptidase [Phycisphaerae bacterium]
MTDETPGPPEEAKDRRHPGGGACAGAPPRGKARWPAALVLLAAAVAPFLPPVPASATAADEAACARPSASTAASYDAVVIPEDREWLLAVAASLAARLRGEEGPPLLLVAPGVAPEANGEAPAEETADDDGEYDDGSSCETAESVWPPAPALLRTIHRPLVILQTSEAEPPDADPLPDTVPVSRGGAAGAFLLAKRFWGTSDTVVVARLADPEAALLASALAAHLGAPLLPVESALDESLLPGLLPALGAKRVLFATDRPRDRPPWAKRLDAAVEVVGAADLRRRLIARLGPPHVRNVILAAGPGGPEPSVTAWLAPYLSLVRNAPIVLVRSSVGAEAEAAVWHTIGAFDLEPRSITILAAPGALGTVPATDAEALGGYTVDVEPCSGPGEGGAAPLAVGRIPFRTLPEASRMIAQGLALERSVRRRVPQTLMVANPRTEYGALPLCETIARASASEFRNVRLPVDEHYNILPSEAGVLQAAMRANLILYQGHVTDLTLFTGTVYDEYDEYGYDEYDGHEYDESYEAYHDGENTAPDDVEQEPAPEVYEAPEPLAFELSTESDPPTGEAACTYAAGLPLPVPPTSAEAAEIDAYFGISPSSTAVLSTVGKPPSADEPAYDADASYYHDESAERRVERLDGLPLVFLQSCHSLEEPTARSIVNLGGAGVIGSVTGIHSASGGAFAKAFCDGLLYRGDTVGEALRDARNYFLCLSELKTRRGHTHRDKVHRVALSFRLWGDPELRLLPRDLDKPARRRATARLADGPAVVIRTPKRRLPEARTAKYEGRLFPGSQAAGIVKRLKNTERRRLMPLHFFRLEAGRDAAAGSALVIDGEPTVRAVYLAEPFDRYLYVLFLPAKDRPNATYTLTFAP